VTFLAVADVGEGPGALGPPYFAKKKKENHRRKKSWQGQQNKPPPPEPRPLLAQGLDLPLF